MLVHNSKNVLSSTDKKNWESIMAKCPNCEKEIEKPAKTWTYGQFTVQAYACNCGTRFREYTTNGKHSFTLKLQKGKGFVKA